MIGSLSRAFDNLLGRGEAAVTVPPLDGALRPNRLLDEADTRMELAGVDSLAVHDGALVASANDALHTLGADDKWTQRRAYGSRVVALAPVGADGLAVALDSGEVAIEGGPFDGKRFSIHASARCPTAMVSTGTQLFVANGSARHGADEWQHDLMERNASGSVWSLDLENGESSRIVDGLAWPAGLAIHESGLVVSEAWKHRLLRIDPDRRSGSIVLHGDLPGYPGRLAPAAHGWWLAVFAPRSQLVEFVLREAGYRRRMIAEVPPPFWIAPKLKSGRSYYEPLQGGGAKHLGLLKPWAPTMSFGLCVALDEAFQPRSSAQSRADGNTHGVTSAIEHGGDLFVAARGDGVVVRVPAGSVGGRGGAA